MRGSSGARRMGAALAVSACVLAAAAAAAPAPSVRVASAPRSIALGQAWVATLRTTGRGAPVVSARHGATVVSARAAPSRRGRYRVRLRLRELGTWNIDATLAGRRFALGTVNVKPPRGYALDNPAGVLPTRGGAVLVAERGTRNRILRVDPGTGAFTTFAQGVPSPFGLGYDAGGSLLVSSTSGLYRIAPDKRPSRISDAGVSPFAVLPDGTIVFAHETSVGTIPSVGGAPRILRTQVKFAHGLVLLPGGDVAISDTGNGRLLRVDPGSGATTVVTTAVKTPMGLAVEPSGALLVIDFDRGSVVRVPSTGASSTVATGLRRPYGLTRAPDGSLFVTEVGEITRATGGLARIAPDGMVTRIRLTPR